MSPETCCPGAGKPHHDRNPLGPLKSDHVVGVLGSGIRSPLGSLARHEIVNTVPAATDEGAVASVIAGPVRSAWQIPLTTSVRSVSQESPSVPAVIMSVPAPPRKESPWVPPMSESLPRSPNSTSRPASPRSWSLPGPPRRMSLPEAPMSTLVVASPARVSLPAPPVRFSSPLRVSAPCPVAVPAARLALISELAEE